MLAFLGWNPGTEQEIFTLKQLINAFSFDRVNKAGARFDPEKAKWFNHQYLIRKSNEDLAKQFTEEILTDQEIVLPSESQLSRIIGLVKERVSFVKELWGQTAFFFSAPQTYDPKVVKKRWKGEIPAFLQNLAELFDNFDDAWQAQTIKDKVSQRIQENQINFGGVMNSLRLALVGGSFGPDLFTIMEILGQEEVSKRIKKAIQVLGL